jgi:hypothetical protein
MNQYKSWLSFTQDAPELAGIGKGLLYQDAETASAFLATVAPDGGPRVHPVFPVIALDNLWMFIVDMSPKYRDLVRNGWFALHSAPATEGGEEFYLRGRAEEIADASVKADVIKATGGRQGSSEFEALFRCEMTSGLHTKWQNWGTAETWPEYKKWLA